MKDNLRSSKYLFYAPNLPQPVGFWARVKQGVSRLLAPTAALSTQQPDFSLPAQCVAMGLAFPDSHHQDWLQAIELLQPKLRGLQQDIDELTTPSMNFDILASSAYLLQADIALTKIKQYLNIVQRRLPKSSSPTSAQLPENLSQAVQQNGETCYLAILKLLIFIRQHPMQTFQLPLLLPLVKNLEVQTLNLKRAVNALNEYILQQDPLYQLFESELLYAMVQLEQSKKSKIEPTTSKVGNFYAIRHKQSSGFNDVLREQISQIPDPTLKGLALTMLVCYEALLSSSHLSRKTKITSLVKQFYEQVQGFTQAAQFSPTHSDQLHAYLYQLLGLTEALRFNARGDNQASQILAEKAIWVNKKLKSHCMQSVFGEQFLDSIRLSPKDKLNLKYK